ncbi:Spx/MgsR family RNA polymerase-binding regulatory protein [Pseudanabaena sp. FACHB-1277]|jgi:arsenate reductase|uniref:Spx/MgsR family RNA polymerase-binding regulatory protein n=1 Tax=Pseudanabaena cinerea FACHB-1277 TaxID=2949581 RepID=A0A926Z5E7_9CYAN|nr:Spx/MgsR family RNA polymerase-binding regulatory protein [Pseudanabaena cinerea]MBD2149675.1 Spx/MgsR family RNA polymerase-binding regulatory protein [Pseudanabaena cinerea FACHB-1277]
MSIKVYGIPTCGTCKKAIAWLDAQNINYEFINVKDYPPTRTMIAEWVKALGERSMRNTSGQSYRSLGSERETWSHIQWIESFAKDAMLLKRPIFVKDGIAISVGFRNPDEMLSKLQLTL